MFALEHKSYMFRVSQNHHTDSHTHTALLKLKPQEPTENTQLLNPQRTKQTIIKRGILGNGIEKQKENRYKREESCQTVKCLLVH